MNLSIPKHVRQRFIEKKYYKKYFFKVCLKIDESLVRKSTQYWHRTQFLLHDAQQALLREIAALPIEDAECRFRTEHRVVSVFTNDEKFITELFSKLSDKIVEFHKPKNDLHQEVLDQNIRIRVRKRLFDNQFRYKVYFSRDWRLSTDWYQRIKEWLYGIENVDQTRWSVNKTLQRHFDAANGTRGSTVAVYLNEPEDVMICQMRFHTEILYVEEAVLISNL